MGSAARLALGSGPELLGQTAQGPLLLQMAFQREAAYAGGGVGNEEMW